MSITCALPIVSLSTIALAAQAASASPMLYTVDATRSTFQVTGHFFGAPLVEQSAGSGTVGYTGSLLVDVDAAHNTLSFPSATLYGGSQPADQQPSVAPWTSANYGFTAFGGTEFTELAIRGFSLFVQGNATPFNSPLGILPDPDTVGFFVDSGTLHYQKIGRPVITADLHGLGGGSPPKSIGSITLVNDGNFETLTIPVSTSFTPVIQNSEDTITFNLTGNVVATRAVPEPSAAVLLAPLAVAAMRRRRRGPSRSRLSK